MNEKLENLTFEPLCNKRTFFDAELTLCMEESTAKVRVKPFKVFKTLYKYSHYPNPSTLGPSEEYHS